MANETKLLTFYENSVIAEAQSALQRVMSDGIKDCNRRRELTRLALISMLNTELGIDELTTLEFDDSSPREFYERKERP